jgi:hypothetical protein
VQFIHARRQQQDGYGAEPAHRAARADAVQAWQHQVEDQQVGHGLVNLRQTDFPVYGGRAINGQVIAVSQLDACNGITSPTPEFPNGVHDYVLPEGVTDKFSSLNCYSGTVSATMALAQLRTICRGNRIASSTRAKNTSRPNGVPVAALRSNPAPSRRMLAES